MFKVGDKVKCVSGAQCYDTYKDWVVQNAIEFRENYFFSKYSQLFCPDSADATDVAGTVVAVAPHGHDDGVLVLVQANDGDVYLAISTVLVPDETSIS